MGKKVCILNEAAALNTPQARAGMLLAGSFSPEALDSLRFLFVMSNCHVSGLPLTHGNGAAPFQSCSILF